LSKPAKSYKLLNPEKALNPETLPIPKPRLETETSPNMRTQPNPESGSKYQIEKMGTGFPVAFPYPDLEGLGRDSKTLLKILKRGSSFLWVFLPLISPHPDIPFLPGRGLTGFRSCGF
jgi:hypothetical protein